MQVLYFNEKATHLDMMEIFVIYKEAATDNPVTDKQFVPVKSFKLSSVRETNNTTPPHPIFSFLPHPLHTYVPLTCPISNLNTGPPRISSKRHIFCRVNIHSMSRFVVWVVCKLVMCMCVHTATGSSVSYMWSEHLQSNYYRIQVRCCIT